MVKVSINNLSLKGILGTKDWERITPQTITIDIDYYYDASKACKTDDLNYAVDYQDLRDLVAQTLEHSSFLLIETLADKLMEVILSVDRIEKVKLRVAKTGVLKDVDSVSIELLGNK